MRAIGSFLLVSALCLPATAQRLPSREAVITSLSGFESQPSASEVQGWGAAVVPVLASIADDGDVMVAARARAAYALRVYAQDPAALAALRRLAADPQANLFVRLAALDALAESPASLPTVSAQLGSPDADVRAGAAAALSRSPSVAAARAALTARLRVERDPSVRLRLDESLRRISESR